MPSPPLATPRSQFVTVMAWLSLALALLGLTSNLLQGLMLWLGPQTPDWAELLQTLAPQLQLPPLLSRCLQHMGMLILLSLLSSAVIAWASWRLLQRREWARRVFIGLLLAGAVASIAAAVTFTSMMDQIIAQTSIDPTTLDPAISAIQSAMTGLIYACTAMICILHVYLCWKLSSARIRAEFSA